MLARLLSWAEKVVDLGRIIGAVTDGRRRPRIPTSAAVLSVLILFLVRLGSLNALDLTRSTYRWRRRLGWPLPSADSLGRIAALVDPATLRGAHQQLYTRLKRSKALGATCHGLTALVIDGHESSCSDRRRCSGCLERRVKTKRGYKTQYYHRVVTAMLLTKPFPQLLDLEPISTGEDEVVAALRMLERLLAAYPRAFDVVIADALYTDARFYRFLLAHHKDALTVLKANTPELLADFKGLAANTQPILGQQLKNGDRRIWDLCGFTSWASVEVPVRVVRSDELTRVRRQLDQATENLLSEWIWVTTLSPHRASSQAVVDLGHARWTIENRGFNETVNSWGIDHLYRHHPNAIVIFSLLCMLAYNLFHAFYFRNLNPALQKRFSFWHIACHLRAALYEDSAAPQPRPP